MFTVASREIYEEEIKRSRFIARAARAETPEEAMRIISEWSEADANHNCWAYRIGDVYRFSDAGEPGGTAGRPILAAIQGKGLDHVVVVVTRYFGGIKLGAGGLVRAYGGTASKCLDRAEKLEVKPVVRIEIKIPFNLKGRIYRILQDFKCLNLHEDSDEASLLLSFEIEAEFSEDIRLRVRDASSGDAGIKMESIG